jgi:hypothetical protein
MKIAPAGDQPPWAVQGTAAPGPAAAGKFDKVFQEALACGAAKAAAPASAVDPLREGLGQVEGLLDILDEYRRKLAEPGVPLGSVAPLVREMETRGERLSQVQESLPVGNGLKEICNRARITAAVEILKFRRGDYLRA